MLRSFSYAAGLALEEQGSLPEDSKQLTASWLQVAYQAIAAEFLTAYQKAAKNDRLLPQDKDDLDVLLNTFLIEKALQEIRYDLNYRKDQVGIGIQGLLEILGQS